MIKAREKRSSSSFSFSSSLSTSSSTSAAAAVIHSIPEPEHRQIAAMHCGRPPCNFFLYLHLLAPCLVSPRCCCVSASRSGSVSVTILVCRTLTSRARSRHNTHTVCVHVGCAARGFIAVRILRTKVISCRFWIFSVWFNIDIWVFPNTLVQIVVLLDSQSSCTHISPIAPTSRRLSSRLMALRQILHHLIVGRSLVAG